MSQLRRFSLAPIVRRHYASLRTPGSRWMSVGTLFMLFAVPLILGGSTSIFAFEIPTTTLTPVLAATGVLTGAFLAGFVLLTNLRLKMREDEALSYRLNLTRLVGETAVTALYLVTVCLAAIALGVAMAVVGPILAGVVPAVGQIGVGLFTAVLAHIGLTALTMLRRMFSVYEQLFRSDFSPKLQSVPVGEQKDRTSI